MHLAKVEVDAPNGKVHCCEPPGGRVGLLTVDRDIADCAAVRFDEFFRLHKHAAGAAAGVIDLTLMRGKHCNKGFNNTGWRVELAASLAFGTGELTEKIFIHLAEQVAGALAGCAKADG